MLNMNYKQPYVESVNKKEVIPLPFAGRENF